MAAAGAHHRMALGITRGADAAYIPANVAGEIRNEGQEPAVRLAFLVLPPQDMTREATPAA